MLDIVCRLLPNGKETELGAVCPAAESHSDNPIKNRVVDLLTSLGPCDTLYDKSSQPSEVLDEKLIDLICQFSENF